MANYDLPSYSTGGGMLAKPYLSEVRYAEIYIDLTSDVTMTTATDTVDWFQLPASSVVLAGGLEQITAGTAGNTLVLRVGTTTLSGTLASDATAGTVTANADVSGGTPKILTAASDVNLLSAADVRVTGKIRAFIWFCEGKRVTGEPGLAIRDILTGTS
jgi:hypothetical protein